MGEVRETGRDISGPLILLVNSKRVMTLSTVDNLINPVSKDDINQSSPLEDILYEIVKARYDIYNSIENGRTPWWNHVGIVLQKRFEEFGLVDDLIAAVNDLYEQETTMLSEDYRYRLNVMSTLRNALQHPLANRDAIFYFIAVVIHSFGAEIVVSMAPDVLFRYRKTGSIIDFIDFIECIREFESTRNSEDVSKRVGMLTALISMCRKELLVVGASSRGLNIVNTMVRLYQEIETAVPRDHPGRAQWLEELSRLLLLRHGQTNDINDWKAALQASDEVFKLTQHSDDHISRARSLYRRGRMFESRFLQTGSMNDLNEAVKLIGQALTLTETSGEYYANTLLSDFGRLLETRYERTQSMVDLDEAIKMFTKANELTKDSNNYIRASHLVNLGTALAYRSERTGSEDDSKEAVENLQLAVLLSQDLDTATRSLCMDRLSIAFHMRFKLTDSMSDLNALVKTRRQALMLLPDDHLDKSTSLNNLATSLKILFTKSESMSDLDEAQRLAEEACSRAPADDIQRPKCLKNLADIITIRLIVQNEWSSDYFSIAIKACEECVSLPFSSPDDCIWSAVRAADLLGIAPNNEGKDLIKPISRMLTTAVELLPTLNPRTADRDDQLYTISKYDGLASLAAAFSFRAEDDVAESLRLLELGRGLMSNVYFDTRSDLTQLEKSHPELAKKFKLLRDELDPADSWQCFQQTSSPENASSFVERTIKRDEASKEFEDTIEMIRAMDGFSRFLLGPTAHELKSFAVQGPIVFINVALDDGGDAYLVTQTDIRHLSLPKLSPNDVITNSKKLIKALDKDKYKTRGHTNSVILDILKWLWNAAVEPVLNMLGFTKVLKEDDEWPHVWWVPISLMSLFPIHAAGDYNTAGHSALDRVISSYTPTIRALDHARKQVAKLSKTTPQRLLMASMPTTPNQSDLPFAKEEVETIQGIVPRSVETTILECPTKQDVESQLENFSMVHFACHGKAKLDPSESGILFSDWKSNLFSVVDVARINLDKVELAYLSMCHAAKNMDLKLLDESIHMTGACQLAGFPTVIGTLWQVDDEYSAKIAEYTYREMLAEGRLDVRKAALGLHIAVQRVKNESQRKNSNPMAWAPYIHVGA